MVTWQSPKEMTAGTLYTAAFQKRPVGEQGENGRDLAMLRATFLPIGFHQFG